MYCVYFHKHPITDEIFYIGHGRKDRAYSISERNRKWSTFVKDFPDYKIEIYRDNLSKLESHELESELLKLYKPECNVKIRQSLRSSVPVHFSELFYVDETSPSGLRHKISNKTNHPNNKRFAGDCAGNKKYQTDGRPHGWQIQVNGKSYLIHRIIWALSYQDNRDGEMVIDHIDRDPFNNMLTNLRCVTYQTNTENSNLRSSNQSGIKGLYIHTTTCGTTRSWSAAKYTKGKRYTKSFSISKYGNEKAKELALDWLNSK